MTTWGRQQQRTPGAPAPPRLKAAHTDPRVEWAKEGTMWTGAAARLTAEQEEEITQRREAAVRRREAVEEKAPSAEAPQRWRQSQPADVLLDALRPCDVVVTSCEPAALNENMVGGVRVERQPAGR